MLSLTLTTRLFIVPKRTSKGAMGSSVGSFTSNSILLLSKARLTKSSLVASSIGMPISIAGLLGRSGCAGTLASKVSGPISGLIGCDVVPVRSPVAQKPSTRTIAPEACDCAVVPFCARTTVRVDRVNCVPFTLYEELVFVRTRILSDPIAISKGAVGKPFTSFTKSVCEVARAGSERAYETTDPMRFPPRESTIPATFEGALGAPEDPRRTLDATIVFVNIFLPSTRIPPMPLLDVLFTMVEFRTLKSVLASAKRAPASEAPEFPDRVALPRETEPPWL